MRTHHSFASFANSLRTAAVGLLLAILTILFGQGTGILFGANEDLIKTRLKNSATAVRDTVYKGDDVAMKAVLDKSWVYMQRAHLHAGGMGTTAVALVLVVCLLRTSSRMTAAISFGLGAGGLGYSIYWMWAGFRAPVFGSTGPAKESLDWLAIPSSGMFVVATLAIFVVLVLALMAKPSEDPRPPSE